jgi:hypothetical protein
MSRIEFRLLFDLTTQHDKLRFSSLRINQIDLTVVGASGMLWGARGNCGVQRTFRPRD